MINIEKIKPKVKGESDKYSWNLYNFLQRKFKGDIGRYVQKQLEIHWLHNSRWDGSFLEFNPEDIRVNQLLIIPLGKNHGRSFFELSTILREGKATEFSLPYSWETTDITKWFTETYIRDGRCIFDRNHNSWLRNTENRFTYVNNTRKCNWCGEWHKKEIHKQVKIERKEVWI